MAKVDCRSDLKLHKTIFIPPLQVIYAMDTFCKFIMENWPDSSLEAHITKEFHKSLMMSFVCSLRKLTKMY